MTATTEFVVPRSMPMIFSSAIAVLPCSLVPALLTSPSERNGCAGGGRPRPMGGATGLITYRSKQLRAEKGAEAGLALRRAA